MKESISTTRRACELIESRYLRRGEKVNNEFGKCFGHARDRKLMKTGRLTY